MEISHALLRQIGDHLTAHLPEEACGLIGGLGGKAQLVLPVENSLHSPVRFQMDASAQFKAMLQIEEAGQDLLAIFHSHPSGPAHPSATDVAEFYYPGTLVWIASPAEVPASITLDAGLVIGKWQIRGFLLDDQRVLAVKLSYSD